MKLNEGSYLKRCSIIYHLLSSCPVGHKTRTATFRKLKGIVPIIFCLTLLVPVSDNGFAQEPKTRNEKPRPREEKPLPKDDLEARVKRDYDRIEDPEVKKAQPKEEEQPREEEPKARDEKPKTRNEKPRSREEKPLPKDDLEARVKRDYDRIGNKEWGHTLISDSASLVFLQKGQVLGAISCLL